jgi:pyruvate ferredoxin oxidoreductase gamma subunit
MCREPKMLRIRFHGRGGQGAKVASRILGTAAFLEGYYAQDFPLYGAERRGAPIAAFTRISELPIMERGVIFEPDVVIIMDETLFYDPRAMPLSGLKEGGLVFVNTPHSLEEERIEHAISGLVITLDITKVSLDILECPVLSTLAGAVASRISGLKEDSLIDAVKKEISGIVTDSKLLKKNIEASLYCYNAIEPIELKTTETIQKGSPVLKVPFEPAIISSPAINSTGNTPMRKTGNWRVFRPVWNRDACKKCMTCVARCPDGCITLDDEGFPYTDYDNCKGCMICVMECPAKKIGKIREQHSQDLEKVVG